jgi:hypothetical protein
MTGIAHFVVIVALVALVLSPRIIDLYLIGKEKSDRA